jgi:transposase
LLKP